MNKNSASDKMKLEDTNLTYQQAIELQEELRQQVKLYGWKGFPRLIGGTDISYDRKSNLLYAGIVILEFSSLEIVDTSYYIGEVTFPYIPGLLSFREVPGLYRAFEKLKTIPDVLMVDGQGYAHPRRIGLASHLGLVLDIPTIGVAKKRLIGIYPDPPDQKGAHSPLTDGDELIGYVVRTREHTKPVFVSPGHKIDFEWALQITLNALTRYRIPEPTRQAHLFVNSLRKDHPKGND